MTEAEYLAMNARKLDQWFEFDAAEIEARREREEAEAAQHR